MELHSPYASVILTSLEQSATLKECGRALLSVVARNCNTDFTCFVIDERILENGHGPILLEPVKVTIQSKRPIAAVRVLSHSGQHTGRTVDVQDGQFIVDGTRDRALYYEIEFE